MKTYKRTKYLAGEVEKYVLKLGREVVVCDIGTDHGYIAKELSEIENVSKVIATDISDKCLAKAIKLIHDYDLKKIETRLGDGLEPIQKADAIVIAGVGGFEIIRMLSTQNLNLKKRKCDYFVLQPTQNFIDLREFLFKNEIFVVSDKVIEDEGRFYPVIVVDLSKTQKNKSDIFNIWLGRDNDLADQDFRDYLIKIKEFLNFLNDVPKERIENDPDLKDKYNLKSLVDKLLH